jgi:hypothetical protein
MVRRTVLLVTLIICLATVRGAAVSTPVIEGNLTGTELCPQSWCGAAWFWASFSGEVGHAHTRGVALAGITYDFLPSEGQTGTITGGTWSLQTWRGSFSGNVRPGGTLTNNGDNTYSVEMTMLLQDGGTGELAFIGLLDHRPLDEGLPPTITGTISQDE